jgi:pyrroline-5-carboxylate reductase
MTMAIVGVGAMGEAVLAALLSGNANRAEGTRGEIGPDEVVVADARPARAEEIAQRYGVRVLPTADVAAGADTVLLVVKPADVVATLAEMSGSLEPTALVVSLAAGVSTDTIAAALGHANPVVRVMPNTPALLGEGMAAVAAGASASPEHVARACDVLAPTGKVLEVSEHALDAVTAVSGSGPAYVFYLAEAMVEAGVELGLPRQVATDLVVQTILGSARMLAETGASPTALREQVTSPAGTTAAALAQLDGQGVKSAISRAIAAAHARSRELGGQ